MSADVDDPTTRMPPVRTPAERWQELQRVVDGALDRPREERSAYLGEMCGTNSTLRDEAERLLDACDLAQDAEQRVGLLAGRAAAFAAPLIADGTVSPQMNDAARRAQLESLQAALHGRYAVERELGHGGMATVYLARDMRHDRAVALKVVERDVTPTAAARFLREVRIAAGLTHPHVLGVHDSGEAAGLLFYVMPYVEGETLRALLAREGALPSAQTVRLLRELADALAYAHARGVVHRDLKPENILLAGGHAVVADFGIAKAISDATLDGRHTERPATASLTETGMSLGTPAYMAPEQATGGTVDHRADLYALGVIAYELLAGAHPFAGRSSLALVAAHVAEAPTPLTVRRQDVPPRLAALVMQLLAKEPDDRPPSAEVVLRALEATPGTSSGEPTSRRRAVLAVATLLLLLGVGAYLAWRGRSPVPVNAARVAPEIHSLAVLPFTNGSGDERNEYFSDGLTDELAHALAQLPQLRLAGRTASYAFKGKAPAAQEVGRALGVDAFVSATVRWSGDRLRVNPQLVSTADGSVLWDSVYESRSGDVFAVQDSLTRAVVAALVPALGARGTGASPGTRSAAIQVGRGTTDAEAYELYLKGMYYWHERGAANVARAITLFQQALGRDPTFARAYAALALAYEVLAVYVPDPSDSTTPLLAANARRAVTLDSTLSEAQLAMAVSLGHHGRFPEAEAHFRSALRIEPSNAAAHHAFGGMLAAIGRTDDAIAELRMATQLDPLAKSAGTMLAEALIDGRRFREAETEARRIIAIDSTFPLGFYSLGLAQALEGQPDSAVKTLEVGVRMYPSLESLRGRLIVAYAAARRWTDVERIRAQLRAPNGDRSGGVVPAVADLALGDREPLARLLMSWATQDRWYDVTRPAGVGFGCNPIFDPLWSDERFRAAMRHPGLVPCPRGRTWPFPIRAKG